MRVAIYSRKSLFDAGSSSTDNQIQMCKDHLEHKYKNYKCEIYEDEGFSGSNTNRPEFKKMMQNINKIDVLICYRLDRISRNVADFSEFMETLQGHNVEFISVSEQFDTTTPMGRAMIYIASVFAQLERETIAERIKDNMLELARNGRWTGGRLPLGYKSTKENYIDVEGVKRSCVKLEQDREGLNIVKIIYDKYLELGSLTKVETYMLQNGIQVSPGCYPTASTAKIVLHNTIYCKAGVKTVDYLKEQGWEVYGEVNCSNGLLSYNKRNTKDTNIAAVSNVKGIIEEDKWLKVQRMLKANSNKTICALGKGKTSLLTGKLICGECGSTMGVKRAGLDKNGNRLTYYKCTLKNRSHGSLCSAKNAVAKELEDSVLEKLEEVRVNREIFIDICNKYNEELKSKDNKNSNINKVKKALEEKTEKLNKLIARVADDVELLDAFQTKIKDLKHEREELKRKLNELENDRSDLEDLILDVENINATISSCGPVQEMNWDEKKLLINTLVDKIVLKGNIVDVKLKGNFDSITEHIGVPNNLDMPLFDTCSFNRYNLPTGSLGEKLKAYRLNNNIPVKVLSSRLGVCVNTLYRWEIGDPIQDKYIDRILEILE